MGLFDTLFGTNPPQIADTVGQNAWQGSQSVNYAVNTGHELLANALSNALGYISPWNATGKDALNVLAGLYNLPGAETTYNPSEYLLNTPGYNWQQQQGQRALDASAAAKGMLLSGPQRQASQTFGQNLASTYYDKLINSLTGMSNTGLTAGTTMGNWDLDTANKRARLQMQGAEGTVDALNQVSQGQMADELAQYAAGQSGLRNVLGLGALGIGVATSPTLTNALSGLWAGGGGGTSYGGGYTPSWNNSLAAFNSSSWGK